MPRKLAYRWIPLIALAGALAACRADAAGPEPTTPSAGLFEGRGHGMAQSIRAPILVGAGDIASCQSTGDEATAALLDRIPGTVFTAGDNAYPAGSPVDFIECYDPTWGRHKERTRPTPGNHDYITPGAAGYFAYFGERAGPPGLGYYSYNIGAWHIVALNSMLERVDDPVQKAWLRADLAADPSLCTLAYWHHPRFSSSRHGSQRFVHEFWEILYSAGADVVIAAHDHVYERFAPQTPEGVADPESGIRQFVVGTGGRSLYEFREPLPNSEFRYNDSFGVLKLVLRPKGYKWEFIATTGRAAVDTGRDACH